jgi:LuxR family maltose regulon positive regulatory protein
MAPALVMEEVVAQQVSIFLAMDRVPPVQAVLKKYGFGFDDGFSYPAPAPDNALQGAISHAKGLLYNSALRTLLYTARRNDDRQALGRGIELADLVINASLRSRQLPIALQTLLLRAQLHTACGQDQAAKADVARALELAAPEGFISVFVEEGQPIEQILTNLLRRNFLGPVKPNYVQDILAAFPKTYLSQRKRDEQSPTHLVTQAVAPDEFLIPIEPLTPRELEILQLIADGDSNQSIADQLVITLSAVKKHTGNIFRKLNVKSRTQALARARQLGLLPPN